MRPGDAPRRVRSKAVQLKKGHSVVLPIKQKTVFEKPRLVRRVEWKSNAYLKLRRARLEQRAISRKKREAAEAAAGEGGKKKGKKGKKGGAKAAKPAAPKKNADDAGDE